MKGTNFIDNIKTPETVLNTAINTVAVHTAKLRNFNARGDWWDMYETAVIWMGSCYIVGQTRNDSEASRQKIMEIHMEWVKRFALEDFDELIDELVNKYDN